MNNLFSEIFGCYYRVVQEIVNKAPLSEIEVQKIIRENGFVESCFYILPMLQGNMFWVHFSYKAGGASVNRKEFKKTTDGIHFVVDKL